MVLQQKLNDVGLSRQRVKLILRGVSEDFSDTLSAFVSHYLLIIMSDDMGGGGGGVWGGGGCVVDKLKLLLPCHHDFSFSALLVGVGNSYL